MLSPASGGFDWLLAPAVGNPAASEEPIAIAKKKTQNKNPTQIS